MQFRLVCLVLLFTGLATSAGGCLAVVVGAGAAGTVAYMRGDLEAEEPYGIGQTYAAARDAAEELGLKIIEGETGADAMSARVVARDSSDKKVEIQLKAITSKATKLSVRVGTFGDDSKTQRIYDTIREHLKKPAAEVAAEATSPTDSSQPTTE